MADEYVLISGLNAKTSPNTSDVLAICDSGGLNTNKITIPNLLGGDLMGLERESENTNYLVQIVLEA